MYACRYDKNAMFIDVFVLKQQASLAWEVPRCSTYMFSEVIKIGSMAIGLGIPDKEGSTGGYSFALGNMLSCYPSSNNPQDV